MQNCPRCRALTLKEVPDSEDSPVRVCNGCGGLWVPGGEVGEIGRTEMLYSSLAGSQGTSDAATADPQAAGMCPEGHGLLARATAALEPPVALDRCPQCFGLWFDKGEWQVMAQSHLVHHLDDLWSAVWRREQRRKRVREQYLERCRSRFAPELFDSMLEIAGALKGDPRRSEALAFMREMSADGD